MNKYLVIIPAYNEEDTILEVVTRTQKYADICVINDCSTDSTPKILDDIDNIHVIHHKKNTHMAGAILDGMKWAIDQNYDFCITMDAGLSHNPDEIPRFLEFKKADLVFSRRTEKNNTPFLRKSLSLVGNFIYNMSLDFPRRIIATPYFHDISSGYRRYSKRAMKLLVGSEMQSRSFDFMIESAYRVFEVGLIIEQCPISYNFSNSSLNRRVVQDCATMALKLLFHPKLTN